MVVAFDFVMEKKKETPILNLLFYTSSCGKIAKQVQAVAEALVPRDRLDICQTLGNLAHRLGRPGNIPDIAVLFACNTKELESFISLREFFSSIRILLIVPNRKRSTIERSHLLGPRYLGFSDGDVREVKAVLSKMLDRQLPKQPGFSGDPELHNG